MLLQYYPAPLPCFRAPSLQSIALGLGSGSLQAGLIIADLIYLLQMACAKIEKRSENTSRGETCKHIGIGKGAKAKVKIGVKDKGSALTLNFRQAD